MSQVNPTPQTSSQPASLPASFLPPELLLSLATPPVLLALVGSKALTIAVRELGLLSEEIFRGDRLPVLHFPSATDPHPDDRSAL